MIKKRQRVIFLGFLRALLATSSLLLLLGSKAFAVDGEDFEIEGFQEEVKRPTPKQAKTRRLRTLKSRRKGELGPHQEMWIGPHMVLAQTRQAARTVNSSSDSSFVISEASGTAPYFGVSANIPLGSSFSVLASFSRRQVEMNGTVTIGNSPPTAFFLEQTAYGVGILGKYYPNGRMGTFWLGLGGDISKITESRLTYGNGTSVPVSDQGLTTNVMIQLGTGIDFKIFRSLVLFPDFRIGYVTSASPAIMTIEGHVGLGYIF